MHQPIRAPNCYRRSIVVLLTECSKESDRQGDSVMMLWLTVLCISASEAASIHIDVRVHQYWSQSDTRPLYFVQLRAFCGLSLQFGVLCWQPLWALICLQYWCQLAAAHCFILPKCPSVSAIAAGLVDWVYGFFIIWMQNGRGHCMIVLVNCGG